MKRSIVSIPLPSSVVCRLLKGEDLLKCEARILFVCMRAWRGGRVQRTTVSSDAFNVGIYPRNISRHTPTYHGRLVFVDQEEKGGGHRCRRLVPESRRENRHDCVHHSDGITAADMCRAFGEGQKQPPCADFKRPWDRKKPPFVHSARVVADGYEYGPGKSQETQKQCGWDARPRGDAAGPVHDARTYTRRGINVTDREHF